MRKIEEKMLNALLNGKKFKRNNTQVTKDGSVYLFGNHIADLLFKEKVIDSNTIERVPCGLRIYTVCWWWPTATTASRLNVLTNQFCGCRIGRTKGVFIIRKQDRKEYPLFKSKPNFFAFVDI